MSWQGLQETDKHAWLQEQIEVLRAGQLDRFDGDNLIACLVDMGIRNQRELRARFVVLLTHMLQARLIQPERMARRSQRTIAVQRKEIAEIFAYTPSMRQDADWLFDRAYVQAVIAAADETCIPEDSFPAACPWSLDEAMDASVFMPPPD